MYFLRNNLCGKKRRLIRTLRSSPPPDLLWQSFRVPPCHRLLWPTSREMESVFPRVHVIIITNQLQQPNQGRFSDFNKKFTRLSKIKPVSSLHIFSEFCIAWSQLSKIGPHPHPSPEPLCFIWLPAALPQLMWANCPPATPWTRLSNSPSTYSFLPPPPKCSPNFFPAREREDSEVGNGKRVQFQTALHLPCIQINKVTRHFKCIITLYCSLFFSSFGLTDKSCFTDTVNFK